MKLDPQFICLRCNNILCSIFLQLCLRVAKGDIEAGAAVVRPPGHHAEADSAMGFCLFNNVAVAAHVLVHGKVCLKIHYHIYLAVYQENVSEFLKV